MEPLLHRFRADAAAIAGVRRAVRAWLEAAEADTAVIDDLVVVVSELCAHAVVHASPGDVAVGATLVDDVVSLEVAAVRDDAGVIPIGRAADPLGAGQPGRLVVEELCDDLQLASTARGPVLRCRRHRLDAARPRQDGVRRPGR